MHNTTHLNHGNVVGRHELFVSAKPVVAHVVGDPPDFVDAVPPPRVVRPDSHVGLHALRPLLEEDVGHALRRGQNVPARDQDASAQQLVLLHYGHVVRILGVLSWSSVGIAMGN